MPSDLVTVFSSRVLIIPSPSCLLLLGDKGEGPKGGRPVVEMGAEDSDKDVCEVQSKAFTDGKDSAFVSPVAVSSTLALALASDSISNGARSLSPIDNI